MIEHKMELVEYRDANFAMDANDIPENEGDFINAVMGWVQEGQRWLSVVSEITPGGERCITRIPVENVVARKRLKVIEDGVQ